METGSSKLPIQARKKRKIKKKKINPAVQIYKKSQEIKQPIQESDDSSSTPEDYSDNEDEGSEGYKKGGYHPVSIGDTFKEGRYTVLQKLGWGHFSTVWLCSDSRSNQKVALKIVKSAKHYTEAAEDEIKLLKKITDGDPQHEKCTIHLLDNFDHIGPNGRHIAMCFEVMGSNLLDLIKYYNYRGIPVPIVKSICKQILIGLDYLHTKCKIIHTDLKPENVLLSITLPKRKKRSSSEEEEEEEENEAKKEEQEEKEENEARENNQIQTKNEEESEEIHSNNSKKDNEEKTKSKPSYIQYREIDENNPSTYISKIADFGNACWVDHHFTNDIQTRQYRAPEFILGQAYDTSVDMWSMACMVFELLTGDLLFEPKSGKSFDKNDDHLAQIIELLGNPPKKIWSTGKYSRDFFNSKGQLKNIKNLTYWPLKKVLIEKYHWSENDADEVCSFILPMLDYSTEKRATAGTMLQHSWLKNIP